MTGVGLLALAAALYIGRRGRDEVRRVEWLLDRRFDPTRRRPPERSRLTGAVGGRLFGPLLRERRHAAEADELGRVVAALIEEYEAGASPGRAFAHAGRGGVFADEFAHAARLAERGEPVRFPSGGQQQLAALALACRVNSLTGTPLVRALSGVADDLAADRRLRSAVTRAVSGPRSSAALLAVLPLLGIAMGELMGAHPFRLLLGSSVGLVLVGVGLALDATGVWWTCAIVRRARP